MIFKEYTNRWGKRLILEQTMLQGFQALKAGLDTEGIDIEMTDAWRGEAEQEKALAGHNSNADWGHSPHNFGVAFDCAMVIDGILTWPPADDERWQKYGSLGEHIGLRWGGRFEIGPDKKPDNPHMELLGWQKMNLTLYPEAPPTEI